MKHSSSKIQKINQFFNRTNQFIRDRAGESPSQEKERVLARAIAARDKGAQEKHTRGAECVRMHCIAANVISSLGCNEEERPFQAGRGPLSHRERERVVSESNEKSIGL